MDLGIAGRVALVMGSSRGIGRGIAGALVREGVRVALCARSPETLAEAAEAVGAEATFATDASDPDRLRALPGEVERALGPVDVLVLNTGGPPPGGALDHDLAEWESAYRSLVLAPRILCEAVVPGMRERRWGRIVNVGSSSVREPIPNLNLSTAHRLAATGFLWTLAREVAADGVTVNTVATGAFRTDRLLEVVGSEEGAEAMAAQIPAGRLGTPEEYGDLVAFLCSDRAAYLNGAVVPLDGGRMHGL